MKFLGFFRKISHPMQFFTLIPSLNLVWSESPFKHETFSIERVKMTAFGTLPVFSAHFHCLTCDKVHMKLHHFVGVFMAYKLAYQPMWTITSWHKNTSAFHDRLIFLSLKWTGVVWNYIWRQMGEKYWIADLLILILPNNKTFMWADITQRYPQTVWSQKMKYNFMNVRKNKVNFTVHFFKYT